MDSTGLKEIFDKLPISLLLVCYIGYLGVDYYNFEHDTSSPKAAKTRENDSNRETNTKITQKIKEMHDFVATLEAKKVEVRRLAQELQEAKANLSDSVDVAMFVKMVITEAKKVGLVVVSLRPTGSINKEYYGEQAFSMSFRGVYVQLLAFLDRLSNVSQIVRVEDVNIKPLGVVSGNFVELEGNLELKAYKYLGSKADQLGKTEASTSETAASNPAPAVTGGTK